MGKQIDERGKRIRRMVSYLYDQITKIENNQIPKDVFIAKYIVHIANVRPFKATEYLENIVLAQSDLFLAEDNLGKPIIQYVPLKDKKQAKLEND